MFTRDCQKLPIKFPWNPTITYTFGYDLKVFFLHVPKNFQKLKS